MDFSPIGSGLVGAVIAFFLLGALLRSGKKEPLTDSKGWTLLANTPGLIVLGVFYIPFALVFLVVSVRALVNISEGPDWALLLLGLPITALMSFGVYSTFVAAKFGEEGILYRRFLRWRLVPWNQVDGVVDHSGLGTYLKSDIGRLWISKYRRGFSELLITLCEKNIKGATELAEQDFEDVVSAIEEKMIERVWTYREEELYPSLFGDKSEGIFVLTLDMFKTHFQCDDIDPHWLTYGVHVYEPTPDRDSWLYVTSGMSNPTDGEHEEFSGMGYEFVMETSERNDWAIKRLASMLAYNLLIASGFFDDKPWLTPGDRVPLKEAIDGSENSEIRHLLLSEPQHFGCSHQLESGEFEFIHFVGTTERENEWAKEHGSDELLEKLSAQGRATITDPKRTSIL